MDFVSPLLGADGIAVQGIDDRVVAGRLVAVTRRQEYENVAVDGIAFQIAFQSR